MISEALFHKGWYMGIEDIPALYYWTGYTWHPLTDEIAAQLLEEDQDVPLVSVGDILICYLQYLPGLLEWSEHWDLFVQFDIWEASDKGWSVEDIERGLQEIADHVNSGNPIIAAGDPWDHEDINDSGSKYIRLRLPHLLPNILSKSLEIEYPLGLTA